MGTTPLYVVVYWNDTTYTYPDVAGPYSSNEEALKIRDKIRAKQDRHEKIAQVIITSFL